MKRMFALTLLVVCPLHAVKDQHAGRLFDHSEEGTRSCTVENGTGRLLEISDESNRCFLRVEAGYEAAYAVCGKGKLRIRAEDEQGKLQGSKYYAMSFSPRVNHYRAEWRSEPLTDKEKSRQARGKRVGARGQVILVNKETGEEVRSARKTP